MRLITLLLCLLSFTVTAKDYGNATVSEVTSIYDADTFRVNLDGYPPIVGERVPVRLLGVDTPEIKGKCESEKVKRDKQNNLPSRLYVLLRLLN